MEIKKQGEHIMLKRITLLTWCLLLISVNVFAGDGDLIFNGNIGIGTTTPTVKLHVNGEVIVGNTSASCSAPLAGAIRYNATAKVMEFCNSTDWMVFSSTPQPPPPPDAYTKLLIHADGNGNTFTDSSSGNKTITAYGNVTQSSSQYKFGGKSAYFDGSETYLSLADSDDWNFGTGDFTIDFWMNLANWAASQYQTVVSNYESSSNWWSLATHGGVIDFIFLTTVEEDLKHFILTYIV